MIRITDQMRDLLRKAAEEDAACIVGTASKDGRPQLSPKGSVAAYDDEHLCYWERSFRSSHVQLGENPNVVVFYRNPKRSKELPHPAGVLRFYGTARIVESGPERERAWNLTIPYEQERDPEKTGCAVLIRIDRIEELSGKPIMLRN